MMSRYAGDGTRIATTLFEAAAFHQAIKVTCARCGKAATFNPHGLWWLFRCRQWSDDLCDAPQRFSCERCRRDRLRKPATRLMLVPQSSADRQLPMPPEGEWKRAVNKFRN